jgi:hypothetical protein
MLPLSTSIKLKKSNPHRTLGKWMLRISTGIVCELLKGLVINAIEGFRPSHPAGKVTHKGP